MMDAIDLVKAALNSCTTSSYEMYYDDELVSKALAALNALGDFVVVSRVATKKMRDEGIEAAIIGDGYVLHNAEEVYTAMIETAQQGVDK